MFRDLGPRVDFRDWTVAELIAVLELAGARIGTAPEEITDRSWLPAAAAVRRDARRVAVLAVSAASIQVAYRDSTLRLDEPPALYDEDPWRFAELPFDASWQITLHKLHADAPAAATFTTR